MLKITLLNYSYELKSTTRGIYYIARTMTKRGFEKWKKGKLQNRAGIININYEK